MRQRNDLDPVRFAVILRPRPYPFVKAHPTPDMPVLRGLAYREDEANIRQGIE